MFFYQSPSPPHKRMILFSGLEFILFKFIAFITSV